MDLNKWCNLKSEPSLKHLTEAEFGVPKEKQRVSVQELVKAHIESFDQAVTDGLCRVVEAIPPMEFMYKGDRISLSFVEAIIHTPAVSKGGISSDLRVFPAECRGRRCTYRGKLVADVSWSMNGVPKGIIKQSLGNVPIMVKSKLCNLHGLSPKELIEHHEEAEEMGGYFIVNGIEKVIRLLIMPRRNYPITVSRPKFKSRGQGYTQYAISMRCVRGEHTAINMNLHYLDNGTVMVNFIYRKELFFLPLGFALKEKMAGWFVSVKLSLDKRSQRVGGLTSDSMTRLFNTGTDLTRAFEYLLATGNLQSKTGLGMLQDTGLCVVADKLNFIRYLSHFRCVHRGAAFAKMRTTSVRKLLPESWGFLCPVHTPDGEPCGLMNHLTAHCEIVAPMHPTTTLPALLCSLGVTAADGSPGQPYSDCYPVILDGAMIGWVEKEVAPSVIESLRRFKVLGERRIPPWTEIVLVPQTGKASLYPGLYLSTTPCRMVRPVRNLSLGKQELIGTFEQVYLNVGIFEEELEQGVTTHQELFPHSMLSVVAEFIPFSDHNQSPRNMYQCQMSKQTMGFPLHSYQERSDNKLYRLQTPQSPLVRPAMYDHYDIDNYPIGTNAIVAVISYTGYDMEDAMIVNKSSWERGFAHGSVYKTELIDLSDKVKGDDSIVFGVKPDDPKVMDRLDADGLPFIGSTLNYGDPYYSYINLNTGQSYVNFYKYQESCVVDNIKVCSNDTGTGRFKRICITTRIPRNPTIGDKFASRHGQKGILSRLWPAEDMPFTESGMCPDILFNPHGFPSRMTIGMLIESMAGKSAALHGLCHDATPFKFSEESSALKHFGEMLKAAGYNYYGTERLYSGISGLELEADIFIGVVYYQRLRHMVSDKFQVRTTGARDKVTNQPLGGRNVQGGIRFGEMERDALLAHGTSFLLHDRLFNCSDRSVAQVCMDCGSLLSPLLEKPPPYWSNTRHRKTICLLCNKSDSIETVSVPYVFRYFVAELAAMNIKIKLDVK
ncbi:DNA-directed RNA polymerase I subunit RPA2 [Sinocyclocheilus rhinocerous]|uniref:DNA-directed RNA polymerase I subunit RPA2 n=1 Tax=Sinocyclocheilus rhinocerous TaxID=307959 RepID=UPI0007BAAE6D|nr:PREDICTED: DNA-directed RNA polymerase I subunit RPA2 [Sinocyclocheilus rhinocerous]